jgi:hypothetical protein
VCVSMRTVCDAAPQHPSCHPLQHTSTEDNHHRLMWHVPEVVPHLPTPKCTCITYTWWLSHVSHPPVLTFFPQ